jgi:hypothetical protein
MATTTVDSNKDEMRSLIKEIFAEFAPIMQSMALTPDKLREAQKPYVDPMDIAKHNHARKQFQEDERQRDADKAERQARCSHLDENGKYAIRLQRNFHDGMARGICLHCMLCIEPQHWDWRPVTKADGSIENEAFIEKAHPLYYIVQQLESRS